MAHGGGASGNRLDGEVGAGGEPLRGDAAGRLQHLRRAGGHARCPEGRRGLTPRPAPPRFSSRHERVPRVSISCDRDGVAIRVRVIAAHRDARRRPLTPVGRSPPSRSVASSPGVAAGRRESQSQAVAHGALPRRGVRDGVLHLRVLLAGAGLLWVDLPRDRATPPRAAGGRQASAQPGRPARSLRPPTGLPREMSPPRDSCTFPRAPSIHDHRTPSRALDPPARLPRLWARVA